MSSLHLVTGYAGKEHVTSADQGSFHAALLLKGSVVLNVGNKFAATVVSNNLIKIQDGAILMQGRYIKLDSGTFIEVPIENGAQDYKRNDLIVVRYTKNATTGVESTALVVIKGTPDITETVDPEYTQADILDGALVCDMPLYRVPLDGLNVGELVPLFEVVDNFDERIKAVLKSLSGFAKAEDLDARIATVPEDEGGGFEIPSQLAIKDFLGIKASNSESTPTIVLINADGTLAGTLTIIENMVAMFDSEGQTRFLLDHNNFTEVVTPSKIGASATGHKHTKSDITDFPTTMTPSAHTHTKADITDLGDALSGSMKYADKPGGTYIGDGTTTARTIETGGIGNMLLVYAEGSNGFAIVTPEGAIVSTGSSWSCYKSDKVCYENGNLMIAITSPQLNTSGTIYHYQCI